MLRLGRKHIEVATSFLPSMLGFGATGFGALIYFTDWKVFVTNIPYYSGKFEGVEEEVIN